MLVPWTALQPSERARRWRQVALAIAVASSVALFAAAIASASFNAGLAMLAVLAGLVTWAITRRRPIGSFEIGVSPTGEIKLRQNEPPDSAAEPPLHVSFAAPWLISLRRGTMLIPVWPDSLPRSVFQQLWVHLRWGRAVPKKNDQSMKSGLTDV